MGRGYEYLGVSEVKFAVFLLGLLMVGVSLAVGCGLGDGGEEDAGAVVRERELPTLPPTPEPVATVEVAPEPTAIPKPPATPRPAPTAAPAPTIPPSPTATPEATPLSLAGRITPTATATPWPTPTPIPSVARDAQLSELEAEYRMRCLQYVRENARPVTYAEFRELDPDNMTDLERVLWGQIGGIHREYCQDYWSEPLSVENAGKRNESYRDECYQGLWYSRENHRYQYEDYQYDDIRWDQFSRVANWLDIPGDALVEMSPKPLDLVMTAWEREQRGYEPEFEDEWYGIFEAWPSTGDYYMVNSRVGRNGEAYECVRYYPQLFTGRWIPLDTAITRQEMQDERRLATPTPLPSEMGRWINQRDRPVFRGD